MAGRPRSFDREAALRTAMNRFWSDGYDETTVAVLTRDIGISAPSLYAAFGDKDELFEAAAACYAGTANAVLEELLDRPTAREAVAAVVRVSAEGYSAPGTPAGCFVLSEPRLEARRREMEAVVAARVERGIEEGDVPPETDSGSVAAFVVAVLSGMSTQARDGAPADRIAVIGELALGALPAATGVRAAGRTPGAPG
ncbi:TetR family transcriptional regulator [Rathayibacter sp. AY1F3]|uniref:TetR/AcrR family transcriptional regulator n=1 Tax=Rathayibacter sp. AY1F3 TaxID=2080558 RepID=UPI000CE80B1A|nr:TetR/AcrR family transcriptional regulator [Rathayibacter sp. AY1F3]PPG91012.1 TetR family transcriptional regulator [Rathayibacter sp. AY1F3]